MNEGLQLERKTPADYELAGSLQAVLRRVEHRPYTLDFQQDEALESIGHALLEGERSGYVEMATSTGKTAIEVLVAEAGVRAGRRVLMLAPSLPICEQIAGQTKNTAHGVIFADFDDSVSVGSHYGSSRSSKNANVVVSTYHGFLNDYKRGHATLGAFDLVIADECHRSLGEQTAEALRRVFPGAVKLGFSATPDFAANRRSDEVYSTCLYEFSLLDAIEKGKTAPVNAFIYETDEQIVLRDMQRDFTDRELAPLIDRPQRNGTALSLTEAFVADGRKGIIACIPGNKNLHARLMADLLRSRGIHAVDVGSHLSDDEQERRLKAYERGVFDVVTFTRSIQEGWDSESTSFAINLSPTTSPVRTKQLLGRILRKKPDGRDSVYIDFYDRTSSNRKTQYTAMHALGLDAVDLDRTIGSHEPGQSRPKSGAGLDYLHMVDPKLMTRILKSQGKLLSNITAGTPIDPLQDEWERRLASEGLSAEPNEHPVFPRALGQKVAKLYAHYSLNNGVPPTADEILDTLGVKSARRRAEIKQYLFRDELSDEVLRQLSQTPSDDEHLHPELAAMSKLLTEDIRAVLSTLSEREAGVIILAYGLDGNPPRSLEEIGTVYGVGRARIYQILNKTMSKLRHPSRSESLKPYIVDEVFHNETLAVEIPESLTASEAVGFMNGIDRLLDGDPNDPDAENLESLPYAIRARLRTFSGRHFGTNYPSPSQRKSIYIALKRVAKAGTRQQNSLSPNYELLWRSLESL